MKIAALLFWFAAVTALAAKAQELSLQATPSPLELSPTHDATVTLVLRNGGTATLEQIRLSTYNNSQISVVIEPRDNTPVAPGASVAWTARIAAKSVQAATGALNFRMDAVAFSSPGQPPGIPAVLVTPVPFTAHQPSSLADIVETKVETTIDSVSDKRPGVVYVVFRSKVSVPLTLQPAKLQHSADLVVTPIRANESPLAPYEARALGFEVKAAASVTPGKQLLVFEVPVTWEKSGIAQTANAVITHQVDVGVFGESAVLAMLGIPTFLFLPGFLMLTTFSLVWKFGKPLPDTAAFPPKASTPEFYLISITLSLLTWFLYPLLARYYTNTSRDFLISYGLADVVAVWFGSITFGLILIGLYRGAGALITSTKRKQRDEKEFSTSDPPLKLLQKIAGKNLGTLFNVTPIPTGTKGQFACILEPETPGADRSWVTSMIEVTWEDGTAEESKALAAALEDDSAARVADILKKALDGKKASLRWILNRAPWLMEKPVAAAGGKQTLITFE